MNEYHTKDFPIYHFDVYRLEDIDEFYAMGGEEYLEQGVCLIEWGELIEPILPKSYYKVTFQKNAEKEEERILSVEKMNIRDVP